MASLRETGTASAVIGAIALAFHGYARATQDVDLATHVDPRTVLRDIARTLQQQGYTTRLILPDVEDPLGGVLTVTGDDFDAVQVVNFYNPWAAANNPGESSIQAAAASIPGYDLPVVDVPHLVALKLYAGGRATKATCWNSLSAIEMSIGSRFAECASSSTWLPKSTRCSGTFDSSSTVKKIN